jgi:hypothetical protein
MVRAYRRARPGVREPKLAGWMERLTPADREVFRAHGVNLVGSLLAYLDARHQRAAQILATAELQAGSYGADAARLGASLSDAVEEFLRFRRPFVDELAQLARRRRLDTREATGLLAQAEAALDRMLIVLMLGHKRISGQA